MAQPVLGRLSIAESDARDAFATNLTGGRSLLGSAVTRAFRAIAPAARGGLVNELVAWAKAYADSAGFKKAWADLRQNSKPDPPDTRSTDERLGGNDAEVKRSIEEARKAAAGLPADQRKMLEEQIKVLEAQLADTKKDTRLQAAMREATDAQRAEDQKAYQDRLKQWEAAYPADPRMLIARRLREFLAVCGDVNYDATLVSRNGKQYFADQQYEEKPGDWKICFRAGRDATLAARAAATAWLKELGQ